MRNPKLPDAADSFIPLFGTSFITGTPGELSAKANKAALQHLPPTIIEGLAPSQPENKAVETYDLTMDTPEPARGYGR